MTSIIAKIWIICAMLDSELKLFHILTSFIDVNFQSCLLQAFKFQIYILKFKFFLNKLCVDLLGCLGQAVVLYYLQRERASTVRLLALNHS